MSDHKGHSSNNQVQRLKVKSEDDQTSVKRNFTLWPRTYVSLPSIGLELLKLFKVKVKEEKFA